jgi:hypothetical protein
MRILLTESDPTLAAEVDAILTGAGHEVLRCVDGPGSPFPCRGAVVGPCPLDQGVGVAVSAPGTLPPEPRAGHVGVVCALRHHLPLVVAGPDDTDELPTLVERAAAAPLPRHTAAVTEEVQRVVPDGRAEVVRRGEDLRVTLDLPAGTDRRTAERLAVRAEGAVRRIDRWAAKVDVTTGAP